MDDFFLKVNRLQNLSVSERYLLLYFYAKMAYTFDTLQISMLSIENDTGISSRHVRTLTRSLQIKGYLVISKNSQEFSGRNASNSYEFTEKLY